MEIAKKKASNASRLRRAIQFWRDRPSVGQARWVIGIALTLLSVTTLTEHSRTALEHIRRGSFKLVALWKTAEGTIVCVRERTVQYYSIARLVYQIEHRRADLEEEESAPQQQPAACPYSGHNTSTSGSWQTAAAPVIDQRKEKGPWLGKPETQRMYILAILSTSHASADFKAAR